MAGRIVCGPSVDSRGRTVYEFEGDDLDSVGQEVLAHLLGRKEDGAAGGVGTPEREIIDLGVSSDDDDAEVSVELVQALGRWRWIIECIERGMKPQSVRSGRRPGESSAASSRST